MTRKNRSFLSVMILSAGFLFISTSCSNLPLIGSKKEKEELPPGKTVTVEGMETIKGVNPSEPEPPPPKKPSPQTPSARREALSNPASTAPRTSPAPSSSPSSSPSSGPSSGSSFSFLQVNLKRKVAILDFENNTSYKEEKIEEAVAKKLSDKLEASQRVVTLDKSVVSERLSRQGFKFENLSDPPVIKQAHHALGIQAVALGTVTDIGILSSKASETSDEEVTVATAKVEIRLIDASTGNLLKTFVGRNPIFGTRETGEYSRGKAVLRAIELSLDDILEGFLRQLDLLDWTTTIAKVEGEDVYLNAGKLSGIRIGDTLEVFEPGKEILHPITQLSLGWTTGNLKGAVRVTNLFGIDAAVGRIVQGAGLSSNDVVKSTMR